ncbi:lysophospholipid acyltransferase family protein [Roseisalinus antarcticus]|nr:lauroyl acyltransferase [Roseisalinus antarcticus]
MPPRPSLPKRLLDRLRYMAFRALLAGLSVLPFSPRVRAFGWLTVHVIAPLAGYRRRVRRNLSMVWPDMGGAERQALTSRTLDNFGRTVMENFCHADLGRHLQGTALEGDGLATLEKARRDKRPVLFVSAHFGNHEVPRHLLAAQGDRIGGIYRPFTNPHFDDHYRRTLASVGGTVFVQGREGTVGFARYLQGGGWGILFYDLHQPRGDVLDFMGLPARTATSAAKLALKYDAALVPWFGIRQPDGLRFRAIIEAPIPPDDPVTMTRVLHARLEARIADHPEQWMWVHRRWKSHEKALRTGVPLLRD